MLTRTGARHQVGYHSRQDSRCRLGKDNPEMENRTGTSSLKALRKPAASRPLNSSRLTIFILTYFIITWCDQDNKVIFSFRNYFNVYFYFKVFEHLCKNTDRGNKRNTFKAKWKSLLLSLFKRKLLDDIIQTKNITGPHALDHLKIWS